MDVAEIVSELKKLSEDGYYAQTLGGMPDADYVGYAYQRTSKALGGKGFPYDRDRDEDQWQIGRDRANGEHEPDHRPLTAKSKDVTAKSGFEEAAGTPVNQTMGSRGGQQTGNPAGGMGGGWANRPVKPWDEEDEELDGLLARYGEAVKVGSQPVLDQDPDPIDFEDGHSNSDFDSFPSVLMQVMGSGFGTGLGKTNPSGRGFMTGWTEEFDIMANEGIWEKLMELLGDPLAEGAWGEVQRMMEAPTDDEGRPLRSADPFAPSNPQAAKPVAPGSAGVFQKSQARTAPSPNAAPPPESRKLAAQAKPNYPGKYVGQSWTTNGQMDYKNTQWKDKETGDRRFGRVPSMQKVTMVWDGSDWIPQQEFDHKARTGQLRRK